MPIRRRIIRDEHRVAYADGIIEVASWEDLRNVIEDGGEEASDGQIALLPNGELWQYVSGIDGVNCKLWLPFEIAQKISGVATITSTSQKCFYDGATMDSSDIVTLGFVNTNGTLGDITGGISFTSASLESALEAIVTQSNRLTVYAELSADSFPASNGIQVNRLRIKNGSRRADLATCHSNTLNNIRLYNNTTTKGDGVMLNTAFNPLVVECETTLKFHARAPFATGDTGSMAYPTDFTSNATNSVSLHNNAFTGGTIHLKKLCVFYTT